MYFSVLFLEETDEYKNEPINCTRTVLLCMRYSGIPLFRYSELTPILRNASSGSPIKLWCETGPPQQVYKCTGTVTRALLLKISPLPGRNSSVPPPRNRKKCAPGGAVKLALYSRSAGTKRGSGRWNRWLETGSDLCRWRTATC